MLCWSAPPSRGVGWGETEGAIQSRDKLIRDGAIGQERWTNPAGQDPGLRGKAWEHRVSETKTNAMLGRANKGTACKAWAEALFLYPAGAELQLEVRQLVLGYDTLRSSTSQLDMAWGAATGLAGGLENITYKERPNALQLICLKKGRGVFQHVGLQSGRELLYSLPVGQRGSFRLVNGK